MTTSFPSVDVRRHGPPGPFLTAVRRGLTLLATTLMCLSAVAQDQTGPARERYVPADQLDAVFARSPNGVMLSRAEFDAMLKKAQQAQSQSASVPAAFVIRSANYEVGQDDKHAIVQLNLDIEQFADRWCAIDIPIGNLQVEDASMGGTPAAVGTTAEKPGMLTLMHRKPGRFTLRLDFSSPLGTVGSDRVAAFQIVPHVPTVMNVDCPKNRHLEVNDLKLQRPQSIEQAATYEVPSGEGDSIRLKWTTRQQQSQTQTLVFVKTDAQVRLSTDSLRWNSDSRVSVFGNSITQLIARVPAKMEITSVDSTGLESWKLEDDPDQTEFTRLLLNYRQPFSDDRMVRMAAIATQKDDGFSTTPTLEFLDVTSHTGRLLINHEDQLRLIANVGGGIRQLATDPAAKQSADAEVFDFCMQDYELSIAIKPRDRELFAEVNSSLTIDDTTATFECRMTVETLNAPLFQLFVDLPAGWQVGQITDDKGQPILWRAGTTEGQISVEPATAVPAGGLLTLVVPCTRSIPDPTQKQLLDLPVLAVREALVVGGTYQISAAADLTIAPLEISGLSPIGDDGGTLLFETQGTTWSGKLSVERKPVRLSNRSVVKSWMDARQKTVEAVLTIDITNGTTRTLNISAPEDLGEELRFRVISIRPVAGVAAQMICEQISIIQQSSGEVVDGRRTFQLTFDQRFQGALTLRTMVQQPRLDDTTLTAASFSVNGAVRQHGLIVFEAYPEQQLAPMSEAMADSGLTPAHAGLVEAPPESTGRRTALVYRFVQPDYRLQLAETRFETEVVPSAVCESVANVSVLSNTGTTQRSCVVALRSIGVQTIRFSLPDPDHSYLWSTILNGEAVEVRRDGGDHLVAIPTGRNDTTHVLEVLFETQTGKDGILNETTQQPLQLSIDTDDGTTAPIDVLQQTWEVRYPSSSLLVHHDGAFQPVRPLESPGWLQATISQLSMPSSREIRRRSIPVGIFLLSVFVVTVLMVRRRWKSVLAVFILGFVVFAVLLPASQQAREASRKMTGGTEVYFDMDAADSSVATDAIASVEMEQQPQLTDEGRSLEMLLPTDPFGRPMAGEEISSGYEAGGQQGGGQQGGRPAFGAAGGGSFGGGSSGGFAGGGGFANGGNVSGLGELADMAQLENANGLNGRRQAGDAGITFVPQINADGTATLDLNTNAATQQSRPLSERDMKLGRRVGGSRLSIRAEVASPADYSAFRFRSIGATPSAGVLKVTVREQSQLHALRVIAAALIALICLWWNSATATRKLCLVILLILSAAAAVAVVPYQWQPIVDGILIGVGIGICCWIISGIAFWVTHCCRPKRARKASLTPGPVVATMVLLAVTLHTNDQLSAAPQDATGGNTGPDIVLPYSPDGPELLADRVFLPQAEFLKLYQQAYPGELTPDDVPSSGGVVAAFYESRERTQIKDSQWSQQFQARFVIRSFADNAATITLPLGATAIRSAKLNGSTAVLIVTDKPSSDVVANAKQQAANAPAQQQQSQRPAAASSGAVIYQIRVPASGLHILDVVFDVPATIENSVGRLTLPLRPVPVGTVTFELPAQKLEARVNGRSNNFRETEAGLIIPIAGATATQIDWKPANTQTASDTIFHSSVNTALVMNDAGLTLNSEVQINCRQGQLAELEVSIPKDYAVQTVSGTEIAGWSVDDGDPPTLNVMFRSPVEGETNIALTLFRQVTLQTKESTLAVPIPAVKGASRDSGNVTVLAGRELEVRVHSLSGVSQQNAAETKLPGSVDKELRRVLAWRYTRHPAEISIRAFRTADRVEVTVLNGVQLEAKRQLWTTLVNARISGAPRRRLEIRVPKDFLALEVEATDLADWYYTPVEDSDTAQVLNIQLTAARAGAVNVVLQGQTGRTDGLNAAELVAPQVLSADESKTQVSLWLDAASEIASADASGWKRAGSDVEIDPRILKLKPSAPDISFTSQQLTQPPIKLALREAPASLMAESVSVTNVTDTSIELTLGLNWQISRAGVRELTFSLPKELADVYDFQVPGLRLMEKSAVDDRIRMTLHLQQAVSESFFVLGTGSLPLPDSKQIPARPPLFEVANSSSASITNQSHFWVIVNQSAGLLEAVDQQTDSDDVAPDEIRTKLPAGFLQQSVAIRRLKSGRTNSPWQIKFPEPQQVAPAVVALAEHTTVIAEDGTWRSRHALQVRNESRQFLPVILPEGSRVLYCLVKGQPTRVVRRETDDANVHLVPIPQSGNVATPFSMEIALTGQLETVPQNPAGYDLTIPAPQFPEYRDFPEYGITVARNTWRVYVPEKWHASLLADPRQSNVVVAGEDDFQDAILLSCVDNAKSLISSLESSKGFSVGDDLKSELKNQKLQLQGQRGNSAGSESQREQALMELDELLDQSEAPQQAAGLILPENAAGTVNNLYLDVQENSLNFFNSSNNGLLLQSNRAEGIDGSSYGGMSGGGSGSGFRFALPEVDKGEAAPKAATSRTRESKSKKDAAKAPAKPTQQKRSQLLERRESNIEKQSEDAKRQSGKDVGGRTSMQRLNEIAPQSGPVPQSRENAFDDNQQFSNMFGVPSVSGQQSEFESVPEAPAATGLLSLSFQIPEDGDRHDFVRTGGNPELTLKIRSSRAVDLAKGVLWAVGCLIAAVLLIKAANAGSGTFLFRLLILTTLVSLAGWLLLPPLGNYLALFACIASAICGSLVAIVRSFRRPAAQ